MSARRVTAKTRPPTSVPAPERTPEADVIGHTGTLTDRPRSCEDAEARYVAARDEWIAAMRAASSGRPADLASLAIRQEAYEIATAEVERWRSAPKVAIPIQPGAKRSGIDAVIGQELAWKRMHEQKRAAAKPGILGRLFGRGRSKD